MLKKNSNTLQSARLPADYFTGTGWIQRLVRDEPIACNVAKVSFEPGCRNHWHTASCRSTLIVTEGKGYIKKKESKTISVFSALLFCKSRMADISEPLFLQK